MRDARRGKVSTCKMREKCGESPRILHTRTYLARVQSYPLRRSLWASEKRSVYAGTVWDVTVAGVRVVITRKVVLATYKRHQTMLERQRRLNFLPEIQFEANTSCDNSIAGRLLPEILGQTDPTWAKTPIFNQYSLIARRASTITPAPLTRSSKLALYKSCNNNNNNNYT